MSRIVWTDDARSDVRAIDRLTAMWIFDGLYRYSVTGIGDVKVLQGIHKGKLRLRLGDYRLFFNADGEILRILRVRHRSEAYR